MWILFVACWTQLFLCGLGTGVNAASNTVSLKVNQNAKAMAAGIPSLVWARDREPPGDVKAFRDIILERTFHRLFAKFMSNVRNPLLWRDVSQVLPDPFLLHEDTTMDRSYSFIKFTLSVNRMLVRGFHGLKMTYIRVIRRSRLLDFEVRARFETDTVIEGNYKLNGKAMGFMPVSGDGRFKVNIKGLSLSVVSFLATKKEMNQVSVGNLKVGVTYKDGHFDFKNLMGGGVLGWAANGIINTVGDTIIDNCKEKIVAYLKTTFKQQVSEFM